MRMCYFTCFLFCFVLNQKHAKLVPAKLSSPSSPHAKNACVAGFIHHCPWHACPPHSLALYVRWVVQHWGSCVVEQGFTGICVSSDVTDSSRLEALVLPARMAACLKTYLTPNGSKSEGTRWSCVRASCCVLHATLSCYSATVLSDTSACQLHSFCTTTESPISAIDAILPFTPVFWWGTSPSASLVTLWRLESPDH